MCSIYSEKISSRKQYLDVKIQTLISIHSLGYIFSRGVILFTTTVKKLDGGGEVEEGKQNPPLKQTTENQDPGIL